LNDCGYDTYWISNQGRKGKWNTLVSAVAGDATDARHMGDVGSSGYDEVLLDEVEKMLKLSGDRKAFVIHINGSHFDYKSKYPKTFLALPKGPPTSRGSIATSYSNSILYTDWFLSEVFAMFKKERLLFVYTADHGEVVTEAVYGHSMSPGYKDEYDIPLVIWSSKTTRLEKLHTEIESKLINGAMFYELLRYVVGMDSEITINYDTSVIEVAPSSVVDYNELEYFEKPTN